MVEKPLNRYTLFRCLKLVMPCNSTYQGFSTGALSPLSGPLSGFSGTRAEAFTKYGGIIKRGE